MIPLIILSHRKREFLETALESIYANLHGVGEIVVVDDSGDTEHHRWLMRQKDYGWISSSPNMENVGYLRAMQTVWETGRTLARDAESDFVMLWEEDFVLTREVDLDDMAAIMRHNNRLAQLNLQRQAVYRIERRFGYMESHRRRGYGLSVVKDNPHKIPWVQRNKPFTTNPGLIRREVLNINWPSRDLSDRVQGGAEPAMSQILEWHRWSFGWYGEWNTPYTEHIGTIMKTGKGY